MMRHAWGGYVTHAWGSNELDPVGKKGHKGNMPNGMGVTIVDSLDTLYIMGLDEEFNKAKDWVKDNLNMGNVNEYVSVFETNIRLVGGLLTAFSFTGDEIFKEKAVHIAEKLLPAFDTETGIPYSLLNMKTGEGKNYGWTSGSAILAEFGTLHMEFSYLSDITGNPVFREKVEKIREVLNGLERPARLYPNYLNTKTGNWGTKQYSIGPLGDSFYEYLFKEWIRSGKSDKEVIIKR